MTIDDNNNFPLGYFYIVSKLSGLVMDLRDPENATVLTKIIMAEKKPTSPERDSQLWIHQNGFLTNKLSGLVLDVNRAESFKAIFTRENRLYLDRMKEPEEAVDQRFGYDPENGYIYTLSNPESVAHILHEDTKVDTRVIIHSRKPAEKALNQQWTFELADPPRMLDSDDEDEDDSKRERMKAWFGNWKGWGKKKNQVLSEKELEEANKKVYKEKKTGASYELIAGAVAYQAVQMWEKKQRESGQDVKFGIARKLVASLAAAELSKVLKDRGISEDNRADDHKRDLITKMTLSAADNYFEAKHDI
ncbi:hypothetical protein BDB01DRAFT_774382 [Pilobolus umbonatus]|nr:hypothetical protein BDB01DRAFT_774382 [Pilobolus umbonatus]